MNDLHRPSKDQPSKPFFDLMPAACPGFGAILGILWPWSSSDLLQTCLPAALLYGAGCGALMVFVETIVTRSTRVTEALFALLCVPWAAIVAALVC